MMREEVSDGALSPRFGAKSSHVFTQLLKKNLTVVCGTDCMACQGEFFVNNPLNVRDNEEHALDFALHLSPFLVSVCLSFGLIGRC
jgi:hypothetical protein